MSNELIYTSSARGLRPGTRGFCTVAHTSGMAPQSIQLLEALSGYKNAGGTADWQNSPVAWSHLKSNFLGRSASILSRVSPTTADHTNRSNKLAHHILLQPTERPAGGPAWLASQPGMFLESWTEEPHTIAVPKVVPQGDETEYLASTWTQVTGDAGHAGVLASAFHREPARVVCIVFSAGMPMLELLREALRLLPVTERWNVTFNTYFTALAVGSTCVWRCCLADSEELREQRRNPRVRVMDLTAALEAPADNDEFVMLARTGKRQSGEADAAASQGASEKKSTSFTLMPPRKINQITLRPRN